MSAYVPVAFEDGVTPLNAETFNHLEDRVELLDTLKVPDPAGLDEKWLKAESGAMVWQALAAADIPDLSATYQAKAEKAQVNGYPSLDADGKVPTAQLPALGGTPPLATSLPGSPTEGQEVVLTDSLTVPTYAWHLRYVAAKASNRWVFVGGSPLQAQVDETNSTASGAYVALGAGPSIALPVAGDYIVALGAQALMGGTADGYMSFDIGATAASDIDAATWRAGGGVGNSNSMERRKTGLGAVTLATRYRISGGISFSVSKRWIRATPIAVGG